MNGSGRRAGSQTDRQTDRRAGILAGRRADGWTDNETLAHCEYGTKYLADEWNAEPALLKSCQVTGLRNSRQVPRVD